MNFVLQYSVWLAVVTAAAVGAFHAHVEGLKLRSIVLSTILVTLFIHPGISFIHDVASILAEPENMALSGYWLIVLGVSLPVIHYLSTRVKSNRAVILLRKGFHLVALLLFLPPILRQRQIDFIAIAGVSVLVESVRVVAPSKGGLKTALTRIIQPLLDSKDAHSTFVTSHMELLVAAIGPSWIEHAFAFPHDSLIQLSGLLTVGVGDSAAAIGGLLVRKPHRLPRGSKSIEGLLSFVVSVQLAVVCISGHASVGTAVATAAAAVAEISVKRHDNIILPIVFSFSLFACRFLGI